MEVGEMLLVAVRWFIALGVLAAITTCIVMMVKIVVNGAGAIVARLIRTVPGMLAIAGGVIYVIFLALKGW